MINQTQAQALATLLNQIRPRWSTASMMTILQKNHGIPAPFGDVAAAAIAAARDATVLTPGLIFTDPRFWPEAAKAKLPPSPKCPEHPEEDAHHCRACLADVIAGDREPDAVGKGQQRPGKPHPPPPNWRTWRDTHPPLDT
ncbi:hypothetical protein [Paeniglutamicibacter terrestris]|uniref:Uncharacterized protein n=1 Tax=Paeniglutamicibacter terrestris TaxID=2723403 RepID=A0ABX1G496_9MICC|nr:hypothetical protein [Paeniglutamicibacter terrestris]NKG21072.1 hypothetical protein [Paeniglutamicibacter terrestris]